MADKIFPEDIIENTQEANFSRHSVRSKMIYSTVIFFLLVLMGLLPVIKMDVGIRSTGLIRPVAEVIQITAPVAGVIQTLHVSENRPITGGDPIATIAAPQLSEQIRYNLARQEQLKKFLADLHALQAADSTSLATAVPLISPRYRNDYGEFRQLLLNQIRESGRQKQNLQRNALLFERGFISQAEMDEADHSYLEAGNQYKVLIQQQQNRWRLEEIRFQNELDELNSEAVRLHQELDRYVIRSPVSGTVLNLRGIFQDSYIAANQVLGEISPDTSLVAEAFVSPADIGLLRAGMPVRFQIDAYNHQQWGTVTGTVDNISSDVILSDGQPFFRVRCLLDQAYLQLQNGVKGEIRKGMTFQARFIISRRSLFELLFDRVDDWLNPVWAENERAVSMDQGK
jgi:membrane fusion protein, peptide pheromone/bacteriocin exporter